MKTKKYKPNLKERLFFWIPRYLLIIVGLLFLMLSFDAFTEQNTFWMNLIGFLIHMIPFFTVAILFYLSWKHEKLSSILLFVFFVITILFFNTYRELYSFILVSLPFLLSSILLFAHNFYYHKNKF